MTAMLTREEAILLPPNALLLTPYEPRAIVKLLKVEKDTVLVRFTHPHKGFNEGSGGRYRLSELSVYQQAQVESTS